MHKKALISLAIAASSLVCGAVHAATPADGAYVGGDVTHLTLSQYDFKSTHSVVGVFGGYRLGNYAGEVAYSEKSMFEQTAKFLDVAVIPHYALTSGTDLVGKLGLRYSAIGQGDPHFGHKTLSGNSLVLGLGAEFKIQPGLSARTMLNYSTDNFGDSVSATSLSAGIKYKF